MGRQTREEDGPDGQPLAHYRQLPGDEGFHGSKIFIAVEPKVEVRAHNGRSRVPKYDHLEPVVGDIAFGFVHASPQVGMIRYWRIIRESASGAAGSSVALNACEFDAVVVSVGATAAYRQGVFVVPGEDDRHAVQRAGEGYDKRQNRRKIVEK